MSATASARFSQFRQTQYHPHRIHAANLLGINFNTSRKTSLWAQTILNHLRGDRKTNAPHPRTHYREAHRRTGPYRNLTEAHHDSYTSRMQSAMVAILMREYPHMEKVSTSSRNWDLVTRRKSPATREIIYDQRPTALQRVLQP